MESNYDEDLNENSFFQVLQTDHPELFQKATLEGWIICVPRLGSMPKYSLSHEDFFSHILIPSDELPESHFRTLNDKQVHIVNCLVTIEQSEISRPYSTHILFEETFYTEDFLKYKVLCIETPLIRRSDLNSGLCESKQIITIQTLRDCIDLLWTESTGKEVLEKLDENIKSFLSNNFEFEPLQVQKDLVGGLYSQCLQAVLRDSRLKEKTSFDRHLLENVKLSVETYIHHGIYKKIIKGITTCTAYEDAFLNKIIRNLSDIQLRDLDVRADLYDTVPQARQELARVDGYSTALGKIGCLRRMVASISKKTTSNIIESSGGNVIAADDLLPMIIFLVIKSGLPNWIAHLTFMKQFHFSECTGCENNEYNFLITSLEAAIEHIKSGILLGPSAPEAQFAYECQQFNDGQEMLRDNSIKRENNDSKSSCIDYFFEQVKLGNIEEVEKILDSRPNLISIKSGKIKTESVFMKKKEELVTNLCHPLCSCDVCEGLFSKNLCDTSPTVHSCDDRGFTALHVASLFGRPIIVDFLINCGSNVNASDYSGSTPLHYAAAKGHQNALLLLIHSEAKLDLPDSDGNTPLHLSSNNGHEGCVKALLYFAEHLGLRLNTNVSNSHGDMPLHHAARWGYSGIVQILLEHGASPTIENKRKLTPMDFAHSLHVSKLLLNAMKINQVPLNQLSLNSSHQNVEIEHRNKNVEIAAASKLPLDFSDNTNKDGLSTSSSSSSVKECLGVHPRSTDQIKKVDKLLRAISFGDTRLACYYLGLDGPNSSLNGDGKTIYSSDIKSLCHPLCMCEKCIPNTEDKDEPDREIETRNAGNNSVLNVNVCNPEGFTPLHVATMHGRTEMVRILLDANAHPNVTTRTKGATPLHLACQNQRLQVVRLLLQSGNCDIDLVDTRGNTALHYCCFTGNARLVELVLKFGPRLNIKNMDGKSPTEEAEEKMYLTIVSLLKGGQPMSLV